ncbi:amino acid ABC transporter permease [Xanthobacter dioxanivorans]|uniref:Amino acid ABC transporter permease n=1 Tax=Xanthobacter dioxanivorans TaxID=2528964 RepID=A0A974PJH9_9HYPH|nr:amino acid ABC transporter permease [Xanthobacter dioxanivorans]QRG04664.1 amino acid ABC transporter permease [Xanthobacter dioxanivorans]
MDAFIAQFLNPAIMQAALPDIAEAFLRTVWLSLAIIFTGTLAGLALAVLRAVGKAPLTFAVRAYADVTRSLPPLVIIILWFFGLPYFGIRMSGFMVSWLVLSLVLAAFAEEIFWSGIKSIPKGQLEAARSTGLSFGAAMAHIILPQAIQHTLPPMTSRIISTVKNTALAATVATPDLLGVALTVQGKLANTTPLVMAAVAYLLMIYPLVILTKRIERRRAWG